MLQLLLILGVGVGLAAIVDSNGGGGSSSDGEPDEFTDEEDAIVDEQFLPGLESNFLDLVNEGEVTQDEADAILDAINFVDSPQNIDTGGGDDVVLLAEGDNTVVTGDGEDIVLGGAGDDNIDLGNGDDLYGLDNRSVSLPDDFLTFPSLAGSTPLTTGGEDEAVLEGGDDTIRGGPGVDFISDSFGSNVIEANQGDDVIITVDDESDTGTPDVVRGGFGFDNLIVDEGDIVETGRGFDVVTVEVFGGVEDGYDEVVIEDFRRGDDTIEIAGTPDMFLGTEDDPAITVSQLEDGSGSLVSINGIGVVRVIGVPDLVADDIVITADSR